MAKEPHREPDPPRRAALQHLHHAHRRARHRLGRADAAGRACSTRGPRSRELIYVLLGAARGAGARRPQDARQPDARSSRPRRSPSANTPRGWLRLDAQHASAPSSISICSSRRTAPATSSARSRSKACSTARRRQLGDAFTSEALHGRVQRRRPDPRVARALGADGEKRPSQCSELAAVMRPEGALAISRERFCAPKAHSRLSTSACRLASTMFSLTPIGAPLATSRRSTR